MRRNEAGLRSGMPATAASLSGACAELNGDRHGTGRAVEKRKAARASAWAAFEGVSRVTLRADQLFLAAVFFGAIV